MLGAILGVEKHMVEVELGAAARTTDAAFQVITQCVCVCVCVRVCICLSCQCVVVPEDL